MLQQYRSQVVGVCFSSVLLCKVYSRVQGWDLVQDHSSIWSIWFELMVRIFGIILDFWMDMKLITDTKHNKLIATLSWSLCWEKQYRIATVLCYYIYSGGIWRPQNRWGSGGLIFELADEWWKDGDGSHWRCRCCFWVGKMQQPISWTARRTTSISYHIISYQYSFILCPATAVGLFCCQKQDDRNWVSWCFSPVPFLFAPKFNHWDEKSSTCNKKSRNKRGCFSWWKMKMSISILLDYFWVSFQEQNPFFGVFTSRSWSSRHGWYRTWRPVLWLYQNNRGDVCCTCWYTKQI